MPATIVAHNRFEPAKTVPAARDGSRVRWTRWLDRLRCPATGQGLALSADGRSLVGESVDYPVRDGVPLLLEGDALGRAQQWRPDPRQAKRQRIWSLVPSPVSPGRQRRYLTEFLAQRSRDELVLNIGSGGWELGPEVIDFDVLPFGGVDLCGDIHRMPFGDGQVDAIICTGVLEHIADPIAAVAEFQRILRPGGTIFCTVPFMQAYHEDPEDYRRYTPTGLGQLFAAFSSMEIRPSHGVGSALAWIAADALAVALACDINKLHTAWLMVLRCLFAPLRVLDRFSEGSRFEHLACSALMIEAVR